MGIMVIVILAAVFRVVVVMTRVVIRVREDVGVGCESGFERGFMRLMGEYREVSLRFFILRVVFVLLDMEIIIIITTPLVVGEVSGIVFVAILVII